MGRLTEGSAYVDRLGGFDSADRVHLVFDSVEVSEVLASRERDEERFDTEPDGFFFASRHASAFGHDGLGDGFDECFEVDVRAFRHDLERYDDLCHPLVAETNVFKIISLGVV